MDLDTSKQVCGTCENWGGKREVCEDNSYRVSSSAKGLCRRLKKVKPPYGGCDDWTKIGGEENG